MPSLNNLYVQSLDTPLPPQDTSHRALFAEKITRLASQIAEADAIVVGIGSGLSSAAGYDFYHDGEWFSEAFADYRKAHCIDTMFDGMYHVFSSNEEQWAFNAAVAHHLRDLPTGKPYEELSAVLQGRDYFVLTTNIDGQASRVFAEDRLFLFQGDLRYWQCSQPCNDEITDNVELAEHILRHTHPDENGVPRTTYDTLPRCSECGRLMTPWIRDCHFLEGDLWHRQEARYISFLTQHLIDRADKVLFLELGVSSMTPAIIKMPFWSMCEQNPQTNYVCVNMGEADSPTHLGDRASVITADLAAVTAELAKTMAKG